MTGTVNEREVIANSQYKEIIKWGKALGSFDYYIARQCSLALQDHAPLNATYKRQDGTWSTTDDSEIRSV